VSRRFELHRSEDASGVSGTGVVAEGVEFADGSVVLRWITEWPTSVMFHDRGIEAVQQIHGHSGATQIVWVTADGPPAADWSSAWAQLTGYMREASVDGRPITEILAYMAELRREALRPIAEWIKGRGGEATE